MKILVSTLFFVSITNAQEPTSTTIPQESAQAKITTKDAKKACKEEGKKGAELIECLKEKKGQ